MLKLFSTPRARRGRHLDDISKELVSHAVSEVLVVNPFVENRDLSNTLRQAGRRNVAVRQITHSPEAEKEPKYREMKHGYYGFLKKDGVRVTFNDMVHARLIVVDRTFAVTSSMNFITRSSGGASWEAGIVSMEDTVVESAANSILRLLEKSESMELA